MHWIEILLIAGALIGFVSMGALVARSPSFWISLGIAGIKAALPSIVKAVAPRDFTKEEKDRYARGEEMIERGVKTKGSLFGKRKKEQQ